MLSMGLVAQPIMLDLRRAYKSDLVGDGPVMANCPYHGDGDPSLAIYADHAFCFGCGKHIWAAQLTREHPVLRVSHQSRGSTRRGGYLPRSLAGTYNKWLYESYPMKLGWLYDRGFTDDTIRELGFGYTGLAYSIPVYNTVGGLDHLRFRRDDALSAEGAKYWGLAGSNSVGLYLGSSLAGPVAECWLCEGEFDAALLHQHGLVAVSLTNGARAFNPEHAGLFEGCQRLVVAYDRDVAGQDGGDRVLRAVPQARRAVWPTDWGNDVTDAIGQVGVARLLKVVREAIRW